VLHLGGEKVEKTKVPDYARLLPEPIRRFTTKGVYDAEEHQHCRSSRAAAMAGRIRTWCTSSSRASSRNAPLSRMYTSR